MKGAQIHTLPSLSKQLKECSSVVIGTCWSQSTVTVYSAWFLSPIQKCIKNDNRSSSGLQYVWEYRSPSKSVPPHYQCKLCSVTRLQQDMLAHLKGWKHNYAYIVSVDLLPSFVKLCEVVCICWFPFFCAQKKAHSEKINFEEADFVKDPVIRKALKEIAAEVEKTEGCGQLKVSDCREDPKVYFDGHVLKC